jgi:hypothetical protein
MVLDTGAGGVGGPAAAKEPLGKADDVEAPAAQPSRLAAVQQAASRK